MDARSGAGGARARRRDNPSGSLGSPRGEHRGTPKQRPERGDALYGALDLGTNNCRLLIAAPRYPLARLRPAIAQLAGPPLWLTIFAVLGGALASITVTRGLFDPDYFWHLAVGQRILETGAIPTAEPFSFTWAVSVKMLICSRL